MGSPVVHFEIAGPDGDRARAFYTEMFGWDITPAPGGYSLVDTKSGAGIGGGLMTTPEGVPAYVSIYISVADLEEALAQAESLGAKPIMGPMPIPGVGEMAMVSDPNGNPVGLFHEDPSANDPG